jgi:hypothetical protein
MVKREDLIAVLQKLNDAAEQLTSAARRMNRANPNSNGGNTGNGGNGQKAATTAVPKQSADVHRILNVSTQPPACWLTAMRTPRWMR